MGEQHTWYRWHKEVLILDVRVQPRAKKDALIGPEGGHLRVRIAAPPVAGKANDRLRRFLAREFDVPQSRVEILAGSGSGRKRIGIQAPRKLPVTIEPEQGFPARVSRRI